MIDSKDLRIGNIYKTNVEFVGSLEAKINIFKDKSFFVLTEKNLLLILQMELYQWIDSIPLTESILLQCGFNVVEWTREIVYQCDCFIISKSFNDGYFLQDNDFKNMMPIIYLHQLQNLYFALTGKELPININTLKV